MKIPDGWEKTKIGDHFDVQLGKMLSAKARSDKQYPYLTNFNVRWGTFDLSKTNKMHFTEREKCKFSLLKNDLIMCEGGEIGRCAIWQGDDSNMYYQKALHRIRPISDNASNPYLYVCMRFMTYRGQITKYIGESSIAHLTKEKLMGLPILLPPLLEQKAIAKVLETWDRAIEKTERLIEAKQKRFCALMRKLISGNSQLKIKNGELKTAETGWRVVKLGDVCDVRKGEQLNVTHMEASGTYYALNGGSKPSGRTNDWNTESQTISISEGGNSCGYVSYNRERFWAGGHCYVLKSVSRLLKKDFLYFVLKFSEPSLMRLRVGSGLPNIQKKDVIKFQICFPSLEEQNQIAEALNAAQKEIDLLKKLVKKYKTQKRGLMQKLLTGEWRVPCGTSAEFTTSTSDEL